MRHGNRRGQSLADSLRIVVVRDGDEGAAPSPDSPDSPDSPESPDSPNSPDSPGSPDSPNKSTTFTSLLATTTKAGSFSSTTATTLLSTTSASTLTTISSTTLPTLTAAPVTTVSTTTPVTTSTSVLTSPPIALPVTVSAASSTISTSLIVAPIPTNTVSTGLAPPTSDTSPPPSNSAATTAGIAVGVGAGTALIVTTLFFLWKRRKQRQASKEKDSGSSAGSSAPPPTAGQRYTHRSDDRIINEFMSAAFAAGEPGVNSYEQNMHSGSDEKQRRPASNELPLPEPERRDAKLSYTVSSWLSRQSYKQMLDPKTARASVTSSAQGLKPVGMQSASTWGDDDNATQYWGDEPMPHVSERDPRFGGGAFDVPTPPGLRPGSDKAVPETGVSERLPEPYQPINPDNLKLPPPPGRPPSVADKTELSTSTGSWNTWAVQQHRDKPKALRYKLGS